MKTDRSDIQYFSGSNDFDEVLNMKNRKRRPVGEREFEGRVVRMTWDMDDKDTSMMMEDVGVSLLEEEEPSSAPTPTPPGGHIVDLLIPPGAPKVTVVPNPSVNLAIGGYALSTRTPDMLQYMEEEISPENTNHFMLKKNRTHYKTCTNYLDRLSDEMILQIFRWLPKVTLVKCAQVCQRLHRLSMDESLWRRIDLANKTLRPGVVGQVLNRGVSILRFTRSEIQAPLYQDVPGLSNSPLIQMSKLQYLDLSMATISVAGLEELLSTCRFLKKLSLENNELSDLVCRHIGANIYLEVLNLSMCQGITENGLVPICNNLQRLEALNIAWTNMTRGAVLYLVICLPHDLQKLNLSGCRETLLDEDIQQLCHSCPNLKELDVSDATMLTSQSVEYIAAMLLGLEYIALSRCYHIAPAALPLLGNIFTLLALDVFGMLKESALHQLRRSLSNIEINKFPFSSIARPTTGIRRTSIWGLRVRDCVV